MANINPGTVNLKFLFVFIFYLINRDEERKNSASKIKIKVNSVKRSQSNSVNFLQLESLIRQGSSEIATKIINELIKRLQEIFLSNFSSAEERKGSLLLISSISSISAEEISSQIPKFIHILHLEINVKRDPDSIEQASLVLADVISNAGILTNELISTEIMASLERLQGITINF
jgi:hypothetical protein